MLETRLCGVGPHFGCCSIRKQTASAKSHGAHGAIVKTLFDGSKKATAIIRIRRLDSTFLASERGEGARQESRTSVVGGFGAFGDPAAHQTLENDVAHEGGFPVSRRGEELLDLSECADSVTFGRPPEQQWDVGIMAINASH